jgi:hypothetical protein
MRRLVVAITVALVALSLAGCGGGGETAETPAAETPAAAPAPAPTGADITNPIADRSAEESNTLEPFPLGEGIPKSVSDLVADKQPMLMLFTDDEAKDSDDLAKAVEAAVEDNQGLVDLLVYDVGEYSSLKEDGTVKVDEDLSEDELAQESITLARALGVTFSPYMLIVDDQGFIIFRHSGYVDSDLIERQLLRVTD